MSLRIERVRQIAHDRNNRSPDPELESAGLIPVLSTREISRSVAKHDMSAIRAISKDPSLVYDSRKREQGIAFSLEDGFGDTFAQENDYQPGNQYFCQQPEKSKK